jgi:hypothetical protein
MTSFAARLRAASTGHQPARTSYRVAAYGSLSSKTEATGGQAQMSSVDSDASRCGADAGRGAPVHPRPQTAYAVGCCAGRRREQLA